MRLKECKICGDQYDGQNKHKACSRECIATYYREYTQQLVEAQCSVCGEWRPSTYGQFANTKRRRGGACDDCPEGDARRASWRVMADPSDVPDIVWIKPGCGTCRHGVPEPVAWNGYKCMANAVICQPRLLGRLYVRR